eukprot:jgi/Botrbrau1/10345/Bobra.0321s0020.1
MMWYVGLATFFFIYSSQPSSASDLYLVGIGIADITGAAADINMMGYANPSQVAGGIYTRQWARAYIIGDLHNATNRFVFVNLDACYAAQGVTLGVLSRLKEIYGDLYTQANVALSGIHTHSGSGGYLQYVLYDITSRGFVQQNYNALVNGITTAITRAHSNLAPGRLEVAVKELLEASVNRSPTAYEANPLEERLLYKHNVDKNFTLLKILSSDGRPRGAVSWFAVHGTSINNTNQLLAGDNKGVASQFMEKWARKALPLDGSSKFVGAFAQSNVGDVSPNILGAFCIDTGLPCDRNTSTCGGVSEKCIGRGPAYQVDDYGITSNSIIASRQADMAKSLWVDPAAARPLSGAVDFRHSYMDMRSYKVEKSEVTREGVTCPPAMGYSFAAGTTDGPGAFDFKQGTTTGNPFWNIVRDLIRAPDNETIACHAPKPILLDTGHLNFPYPWQPSIVEVQVLKVGQLLILAVPGELTTMAGRRLRSAVYNRASPRGLFPRAAVKVLNMADAELP